MDLDLVLSPCLTEAGEGGAGCRSPRRTKNLGCSTPRTGLFQDLGETPRRPGNSLMREMAASSRLWGGRGQPLSPNALPFAPVNFVVVWGSLRVYLGRYHPHSHQSGQGTSVLSSKTCTQELGGWAQGLDLRP